MTSAPPSVASRRIQNVALACLFGIPARRVHIYLALLHGVAEEGVQQQVLQIGIPVERLFDFSQEDAAGQGSGNGYKSFTAQWRNGITSVPIQLITE